MALSEQEQRLLDEMERSLYAHEADVVSPTGAGLHASARSIAVAVLAVAVGVAIVVGGLAFNLWWVGLIGFAVIIAGIAFAFSGRGSGAASTGASTSAAAGSAPSGGRPASNSGESFMDRLEDRWDRRRENGQ